MKPVSITCPFTGQVVQATMNETDRSLVFKNAITNEKFICRLENDCYCIPAKELVQKFDMITSTHASHILGVTRQRMSQIAQSETIKPYKVDGKTMFMRSDVLEYKENRKVGAPKKEQ